jgi:3-vinyl bacteriochlorophyllide hydratase
MSSQEHPAVRAVQYAPQSVAWLDAPTGSVTKQAPKLVRQSLRQPLYTPEQRVRRDATVWTLVQGVLAPVQFLVFLISVSLVLRFLATGDGLGLAQASVVVKTLVLYTIMITGCIWEKVVFDKWLFAPAFFWEDVFSMLVLGLHTAYLYALFTDALTSRELMWLALAAYAAYAVNAGQFIWKLRMARLDEAAKRARLSLQAVA